MTATRRRPLLAKRSASHEPERAEDALERPARPGERGRLVPASELHRVSMAYRQGHCAHSVLENVSMIIMPGEFVALTGQSGSGKTTLLKLMAGLERPKTGSVTVAGTQLCGLAEAARAQLRLNGVAIVFQQPRLIPTLTALENVALPLLLRGERRRVALDRSEVILAELGYRGEPQQLPDELSLGERQRLAVARALVSEAPLILADEPTASLDSVAADTVLRALSRFGSERGRAVVLATPEARAAAHAFRSCRLQGGALVAT